MKISDRTPDDVLELVENFNLFDDDYMSAMFASDPKCAEYVLSILIERQLTVKEVQAQKEIHNLWGRSFITKFDKYKEGLPMYFVDRTVTLKGGKTVPFGDDLHIIYVNGTYDGDDKVGELMHDFRTSNPDDMHDSILKEQAKYLKRDVKGVKTMCKAVEDFAEKRAEKRVEESKCETARDMLADGIPVEKIAMYTKLSEEKILELQEELVPAR